MNKKISMEEYKKNQAKFKQILENQEEIKIWEQLENGCFIGTMGYSEKNIETILVLLKSFEEQYGEVIDYEAAKEELMLYQQKGKLFIYFDPDMNPVSMNGCIYNYENATVDFISNRPLNSLYFYGLSTVKEYRGKGACRTLIDYSLEFAKYNNFDYVYARTDLVNSNSEWIMQRAGLEVCTYEGNIIAEWVDVTEEYGDYRLHMWKPLTEGITTFPKEDAIFAKDDETRDIIESSPSILQKTIQTG